MIPGIIYRRYDYVLLESTLFKQFDELSNVVAVSVILFSAAAGSFAHSV